MQDTHPKSEFMIDLSCRTFAVESMIVRAVRYADLAMIQTHSSFEDWMSHCSPLKLACGRVMCLVITLHIPLW